MGTNPGNDKSYLRDEGAVRRAAMMVVDEFGENAAAYAMTRAIALQQQGDEIGASTWRRVAPVIEELQRNKAAPAAR
jgi:hypothetical protein